MAIDPYPTVGDRAFDVKPRLSPQVEGPLRTPRDELTFFAERLDLDAQRIAAWTFACSVQVALEHAAVGNVVDQRACLERAEQVASLMLI